MSMFEKFGISHWFRIRIYPVRHFAFHILIWFNKVYVKLQFEPLAHLFHIGLRKSNQIFKSHTELTMARDILKELDDILVAYVPYQL